MRWRSWAAIFLSTMIVLGPSFAEARAGGSYRLGGGSSYMSQGSRGAQTYSNNGAAPLQRSVTPQTSPSQPYGAAPGYSGYGSSHPFLTGLFGGLFGSWIGSLLFPHWGMGGGMGGAFGSIFSWLLIIGLVWFVFRLFTNRRPATYGGPSVGSGGLGGMMGFGGGPGPFGGITSGSPGSAAPRVTPIGVTGPDYQQFEEVLKGVQDAWSRGDLAALRHFATPEMLSYFSEQLAENESQGVVNKVEAVELLKGEVREAWDEGRLQYASALMHWRARDYTIRSGGHPGEGEIIVGGDPQNPSEAREMWTFARSPGGRWLLSAIQQV